MKTKNVQEIYPLTPRQRAVLDATRRGPSPYAESVVWGVEGALDIETYERAWRLAAARHAALRTSFAWEGLDEPLQVVHAAVEIRLSVEDWRGLGGQEQKERLRQHLARQLEAGFNLSAAPPMRLSLLRTADESFRVVWSHPGLLVDRRSAALVFDEVLALYESLAAGAEPRKAAPPTPFSRFVAWGRRHDFSRAESHWRETLSGLGARAALPASERAPHAERARAEESAPLAAETASALELLARSHGLTPETVYAGAWAVLLSRYGDSPDVIMGEEVAGRAPTLPGADSLVGLLADTLPLRLRVEPRAPLVEWLKEVGRRRATAAVEAFAPLARIQQWAGTPDGEQLFDSVIAFERPAPATRAGLVARPDALSRRGASPDGRLTVSVEFGEQSLVRIVYDAASFEGGTVRRMLGHFLRLLAGVAADPAAPADALEMLTPAERRRLLCEWNDTAADFPRGLCLHELFEAAAARTPDGVALVCGDARLTYAELNARAGRLANYLRGRGVGPESLVGLCAARSAEMVVGLLGILKAGGAYVPLDPAYPAERLAFILDDARVKILLTQDRLVEALPRHDAEVVRLDADWPLVERAAEAPARPAAAGENLAYVIYTSGSTGRPKGVAIAHASAVTLAHWARTQFDEEELSGVLFSTSVVFDLSVFELFVTLGAGGAVILAENALELPRLPAASEVRLVNTVPSAMTELVRLGGVPETVRTVNLAGEPLPRKLARQIYERTRAARVVNLYGPSEDTTYSTFDVVARDEAGGVSIGRPVSNTQAYVLDSRLHPVPQGVTGELYLGGAGLARGYLRRPALTAERFVPDPFAAGPGARMYRTGDLARFLPDGRLDFLGRTDHQVKLRGFRIELGEIEAALESHPAVRQCVLVLREESSGDKSLTAYVVGEGAAVAADELRDFLKRSLPEYMVPSRFVPLAEMPLTPNGKIDREALPAPRDAGDTASPGYKPPHTPVQELLAGIFSEVLGAGRVGLHDNFFRLGGHSLLATQVVLRVREVFGADMPLRLLFEAPTVAGLAPLLESALREPGAAPTPEIEPAPRGGHLPLSYAQQRLWFVQQLEPESAAYNIASAVRLSGRLDVRALEQTFNEIVRRHEALRTSFAEADGQPVQVVAPALSLRLPVVELSGLGEHEREAAVRRLMDEEAATPFRLSEVPLLRVKLFRAAPDEHFAVLVMHHIVSDGWSMDVLVRDVAALYEAFSRGLGSRLPELPVQYADYAVWQRRTLEGERLETHLAYWRERLRDSPAPVRLRADRPRPAADTFRSGDLAFTLPAGLRDALHALGRAEGVTLFMTLLAAFQTLLYRYTGQADVVLGTNVANRPSARSAGLIGFFVNMLVLRTDLSGDPSFRELLGRVREMSLEALAHQDVPFDELVRRLRPERGGARTPLFETVFSLQNATREVLRLPGLTLEPVAVSSGQAKYDVVLNMWETERGLGGLLQYNRDLFEASTAARLLRHFETLLASIAAEPGARLSALEMLSADERVLFEKATHIDELNAIISL